MANVKRPLVVGNWKMNLDFVEGLHLVQQLGLLMKNRPVEHTDVVVVPPFVDLRTISSILDSERLAISLGAQHVNPNDNGAYTGEGLHVDAGAPQRRVGHRGPLRAARALFRDDR